MRVNTGLSTPHVFPVRVLYFVSRPTWRVALCSARIGASPSCIHSAGDREIISQWDGFGEAQEVLYYRQISLTPPCQSLAYLHSGEAR
jgi:hypothetical protein